MPDTRFILDSLRQLLIRLDDHARAMPRMPSAAGQPESGIRDQSSFVHGLALVAVRQAMFDVFEAHAPDGDRTWPRHFVPLLQDFDVASLPIDDTCTSTPTRAVPASAGMAVYAGAACFVGIMACRYAPTTALGADGWTDEEDQDGMRTAAALVPALVGRLQTEGLLDETAAPFIELVTALAASENIPDLVDIVAIWDRRVAMFAEQHRAGTAAA